MGTLTKSEDPDEMPQKCNILPGPALFARIKTIFRKLKYIIIWKLLPVTP